MGRIRRALTLAESPIGRGLPLPTSIAMCAIAFVVVARDVLLLDEFSYLDSDVRVAPAAAAMCLFVYLARDRLEAVGGRGRPLPSLAFWLKATLAIAIVFAVVLGVALVIYLKLGFEVQASLPEPFWIWNGVVDAPLVEETIYRWVLVTGIAAVAPRWLAVVVSGAVFAYLHFLYGSAGPDNFIAGYFFAWMYLRSGSIVVPMVFHAMGNGTLMILNVLVYEAF